MQLRPDWKIQIEKIGHTDVHFIGKQRLVAPGAMVRWMTPFHMHTEWFGSAGERVEVGFSIAHRDIDLFNDVAPEIIKFIKD